MRARQWLVACGVIMATLVLAMPATAQGNGKGKKGGGGNSPKPLVMVFRDAAGDAIHSDGGAYIDGELGIKEAVLSEQGTLYVDANPKNGDEIRGFTIDFSKATQVDPGWGDPPPASGVMTQADLGVYADDGLGHNTEGGAGAMVVGQSQWARLPLFFADPNVRRSGWKLSYSKNSLRDGTPGVGFAILDCIWGDGDGCTVWVAHKDKGPADPDSNLAALISFKPNEGDAGEWVMPFAIGFCLQSYVEAHPMYPSLGLVGTCELLLEAHPVFTVQ